MSAAPTGHYDGSAPFILVMNLKFPEDSSTAVQHRDRAVRGGQDTLFDLSAGISSYLRLVRLMGNNDNAAATNAVLFYDKYDGRLTRK